MWHSYNTCSAFDCVFAFCNRIAIDSCANNDEVNTIVLDIRLNRTIAFDYDSALIHRNSHSVDAASRYWTIACDYICVPNRSFAIRTLGNCIFSTAPKPTQPKSRVNTTFHGICVIISVRCKLIQMWLHLVSIRPTWSSVMKHIDFLLFILNCHLFGLSLSLIGISILREWVIYGLRNMKTVIFLQHIISMFEGYIVCECSCKCGGAHVI